MLAAAPPAVAQIAQRAEQQERGIVLYRLRRVFDVHAGPMRRHDETVLAMVAEDTQVIKVRVLSAFVGGKALDDRGKRQIEDQYEHPKPSDVFHPPFDPRYLAEYTYNGADSQAYTFASTLRDGSHGNGTFWLDGAGDVVKYVYTPNFMPQYASSGTVTGVRSQVLPGFWHLTSETHQYSGRYFIFSGGATVAITYDSFSRYSTLPAALAALQS